MRNHPAINYYRSGIPIVIAGDDPGSFGYNDLTVDYYLAFMSWGLSLHDLREIANNSIRHSSVPDQFKSIGYAKFKTLWDTFINQTYAQICDENRSKTIQVNITNIHPSYGPNDFKNRVTIFGYGYEYFLCKRIYCVFGLIETDAYLNKVNEIVCDTPLGFGENQVVQVAVLVDDSIINTGLTYEFVASGSIRYEDDYVDDLISNRSCSRFTVYLFLIYFSALFINIYLII